MTSFTIHTATDIAPARYFLRRRLSGDNWTPNARARGVAALTILAELILSSGTYGTLSVATIKNGDADVLKLSCTVHIRPGDQSTADYAQHQLRQLADEMNFTNVDEQATVGVYIWGGEWAWGSSNSEESDQDYVDKSDDSDDEA